MKEKKQISYRRGFHSSPFLREQSYYSIDVSSTHRLDTCSKHRPCLRFPIFVAFASAASAPDIRCCWSLADSKFFQAWNCHVLWAEWSEYRIWLYRMDRRPAIWLMARQDVHYSMPEPWNGIMKIIIKMWNIFYRRHSIWNLLPTNDPCR